MFFNKIRILIKIKKIVFLKMKFKKIKFNVIKKNKNYNFTYKKNFFK